MDIKGNIATEDWKVNEDIIGAKGLPSQVSIESALAHALRTVSADITERRVELATRVCMTSIKPEELRVASTSLQIGLKLLHDIGIEYTPSGKWKVDNIIQTPEILEAKLDKKTTLRNCIHIGTTTILLSGANEIAKLHIKRDSQGFINEVKMLQKASSMKHSPRLHSVVVIQGIPSTIQSKVEGSKVAALGVDILSSSAHLQQLIINVLSAFVEAENLKVCNLEWGPNHVVATPTSVTLVHWSTAVVYQSRDSEEAANTEAVLQGVPEKTGLSYNESSLQRCLFAIAESSAKYSSPAIKSAIAGYVRSIKTSANTYPPFTNTTDFQESKTPKTAKEMLAMYEGFHLSQEDLNDKSKKTDPQDQQQPTESSTGSDLQDLKEHHKATSNRIAKRIEKAKEEDAAKSTELETENVEPNQQEQQQDNNSPESQSKPQQENEPVNEATKLRDKVAASRKAEEQQQQQQPEEEDPEVVLLKQRMMDAKKNIRKASEEADITKSACLSNWLEEQERIEEQLRQDFIGEIERDLLKERLREAKQSDRKPIKEGEDEEDEEVPKQTLDWIDDQANEEEKLREKFMKEIEMTEKIKQCNAISKKMRSQSVIAADEADLQFTTDEQLPEDWLEQQRLEEERRRQQFIEEINAA